MPTKTKASEPTDAAPNPTPVAATEETANADPVATKATDQSGVRSSAEDNPDVTKDTESNALKAQRPQPDGVLLNEDGEEIDSTGRVIPDDEKQARKDAQKDPDPPVSVGEIVMFRSRNGAYTLPAIVTATRATLAPSGLEAGRVPNLASDDHVHLTVFSPELPNLGAGVAKDAVPVQNPSAFPRSESDAGCHPEWNVPRADDGKEHDDAIDNDKFGAGTWALAKTRRRKSKA